MRKLQDEVYQSALRHSRESFKRLGGKKRLGIKWYIQRSCAVVVSVSPAYLFIIFYLLIRKKLSLVVQV